MHEDPIVNEVRKVRDEHAASFNYQLSAIIDDIRRLERESGRKYVNYPPRRVPKSDSAKPAADRKP
jgi:hypothetical protein